MTGDRSDAVERDEIFYDFTTTVTGISNVSSLLATLVIIQRHSAKIGIIVFAIHVFICCFELFERIECLF